MTIVDEASHFTLNLVCKAKYVSRWRASWFGYLNYISA